MCYYHRPLRRTFVLSARCLALSPPPIFTLFIIGVLPPASGGYETFLFIVRFGTHIYSDQLKGQFNVPRWRGPDVQLKKYSKRGGLKLNRIVAAKECDPFGRFAGQGGLNKSSLVLLEPKP